MFKIPSLQQLLSGFVTVVKRFPLEMLAALIGTITYIVYIKNETTFTHEQTQLCLRIILSCVLALTLFLSVSLFAEQHSDDLRLAVVLKISALVVIIALFFVLHPIDETTNSFRYGFLIVSFHLLVSFAPFLSRPNLNAFWEYNKILFLRILTAGLYSTVLFLGLCIAIASTDALFNLDVSWKTYSYLAGVTYGLFNTCFFLAGVPAQWLLLEDDHTYPKALRIFTQFVLIPLATIYLCILLAYEGKVIIEWSLPKGLVSSLVLGYAVYGILSILLVYPVRNQEGNKWINTFSKWFYVLMIPLLFLLGAAIIERVNNYGITESRYILIVLGLWLTAITAYFLISSAKNIKIIPISLCIVALLCTWGPQSASHVSYRSQMNRLTQLFTDNNSYKDGKFSPLPDSVSHEKKMQAYETVSFIVSRYGFRPFLQHLTTSLDYLKQYDTLRYSYERNHNYTEAISKLLNVEYVYAATVGYSAFSETETINVEGFDAITPLEYNGYNGNRTSEGLELAWHTQGAIIEMKILSDTIKFDMGVLLKDIIAKKEASSGRILLPDSKLLQQTMSGNYQLVITSVYFNKEGEEYNVTSIRGYLLFRIKE